MLWQREQLPALILRAAVYIRVGYGCEHINCKHCLGRRSLCVSRRGVLRRAKAARLGDPERTLCNDSDITQR